MGIHEWWSCGVGGGEGGGGGGEGKREGGRSELVLRFLTVINVQ